MITLQRLINSFIIFLILSTSVHAEVYISDHFDLQPDWSACSEAPTADNPSPWSSHLTMGTDCTSLNMDKVMSGAEDDAHGSTGKYFKIDWPNSLKSLALATYTTTGKSFVWIGFWWRHNADFNLTGSEAHKWTYFAQVGGDRCMLSLEDNTLSYFDGTAASYNLSANTGANPHPNTSQASWYNDTTWHYYIIYISPADSDLRVFLDGDELTWNGDNLNIGGMGKASTFDDDYTAFGYQSREGWVNNETYFDDIIIASTKAEVENFLGESAPESSASTSFGEGSTVFGTGTTVFAKSNESEEDFNPDTIFLELIFMFTLSFIGFTSMWAYTKRELHKC